MDPNTILTELQLQKADETDEVDGEEIYYTILQDDTEEEDLALKTEDSEFLDANNIFYLSFKDDDDQEESDSLPQQEENATVEESNVNMEFLEQITLPDGTQAYMKREPSGILDDNDKLLRIQSESFEISEDMLFENLNEDFESKDSDEEIGNTDELGSNLVFTQENDEDNNVANYEQVQLEDGTIAMIEKNLYNKLVKQNKKKEASKTNEQAASTSSGTSKSFKCPQENCPKSYTTLHHLRVHMRNHTGHKPYKCSIDGCDKTFSVGYSLKAHSRTHTGEKPYGCQTCLKRFKTSGDLQKHNRIHTGEKPFLCPIEGCGRSFTTSNIRKVHIRSHTGERPYKCPEGGCNKAFASATNYKNHIRIHSGERPYQCSFEGCGKRFTEYSSLYKHQTVHNNSKACKCEYCGKDFRQPSTLVSHKRTMHNIIITENGTEIMVKMVEEQAEEEENNAEEQGLGDGEMQFFFVAQTE